MNQPPSIALPLEDPPAPNEAQVVRLVQLVDSMQPLVGIETVDEDRVVALLEAVAHRKRLPLFTWRAHRGLTAPEDERRPIHGTEAPAHCLAFVEESDREAIYHLRDFGRTLDDAVVASRLKEIYRRLYRHRGMVVISGADLHLTPEIEPLVTSFDLGPPSVEEQWHLVATLLHEARKHRPISMELSSAELRKLIDQMKGLNVFEVRRVLSTAMLTDGRLSAEDIESIAEAKKRIIERTGVLEYFPNQCTMGDVAGLAAFKTWARARRTSFLEPERARSFGIEPPRGALLLGVQGCGKSLSAKALAGDWGLPLVRLDPSNLYQRYVGETEKSLRRALRTAETMAPIILWVDELEKAFAQANDGDGGLSRRIFGTFLSWLQEKHERVFVIATANDVSSLPPELLRKGRFDDIFFIDLPVDSARATTFSVHLARRKRDPGRFDLAALAGATHGFSGAEIEAVVTSALVAAFAEGRDITTADLLVEAERAVPLSVTAAERLEELRAWARNRAVPAD